MNEILMMLTESAQGQIAIGFVCTGIAILILAIILSRKPGSLEALKNYAENSRRDEENLRKMYAEVKSPKKEHVEAAEKSHTGHHHVAAHVADNNEYAEEVTKHRKDKHSRTDSSDGELVTFGVWTGLKFGFGFAAGVFLFCLILSIVGTAFIGAAINNALNGVGHVAPLPPLRY